MKRLIATASLILLLTGSQLLINCASPLESTLDPDPNPNPPPSTLLIFDTVFISDSIFIVDTLIQVDTVNLIDTQLQIDTIFVDDTIIQIDTIVLVDTLTQFDTVIQVDTVTEVDTVISVDTIIQFDTVYVIDTVIIEVPDSTGGAFCGRLSSTRKEIIWLSNNAKGRFLLEFSAFAEFERPEQTLNVEIDGQMYFWTPTESMEFTVEQDLKRHVMIRITSTPAHGFGHPVDICLKMTKL